MNTLITINLCIAPVFMAVVTIDILNKRFGKTARHRANYPDELMQIAKDLLKEAEKHSPQ